MKILITGGAGFIGSAVVRFIINETDDEVVVVDALTYAGNLESLHEVSDNPRYQFEHANICNRQSLDRIFSEYKPDAVMHLAQRVMLTAQLMALRHLLKLILLVPILYWKQQENTGINLIV